MAQTGAQGRTRAPKGKNKQGDCLEKHRLPFKRVFPPHSAESVQRARHGRRQGQYGRVDCAHNFWAAPAQVFAFAAAWALSTALQDFI